MTFPRIFLVFFALFSFTTQAEQAPPVVYDVVPTLEAWGQNAELVAAVKAHNAQGLSLAEIQSRDQTWQASSEVTAFMKTLLDNPAAQQLRQFEQEAPHYFELFLMGNQGAIVAMTNKTSDYWQGDEAKFTESYAGGQGAVHVSEVEFDQSAQAYLVQVSVPVRDGDTVIGAMTVGIDLDVLQ